jgi:glycerol kinase
VNKPLCSWVEHDPLEILQRTRECIEETLRKGKEKGLGINSDTVKAIGITNQRETTLVWSRKTGKPLHNAIVWLDIRTRTLCKKLQDELSGGVNHFRDVTGLPISTYFSAVKLKWLLENVPEVSDAVDAGDAMVGTLDTWLIWNLTGGCGSEAKFVTDCTNAARTMLMDLKTLEWHQPSLDELGIKTEILPE